MRVFTGAEIRGQPFVPAPLETQAPPRGRRERTVRGSVFLTAASRDRHVSLCRANRRTSRVHGGRFDNPEGAALQRGLLVDLEASFPSELRGGVDLQSCAWEPSRRRCVLAWQGGCSSTGSSTGVSLVRPAVSPVKLLTGSCASRRPRRPTVRAVATGCAVWAVRDEWSSHRQAG